MNITFLRTFSEKHDNSEDDIIYEAKISCLVSGWDSYSWVAYMFIDLYFEECLVDEDLESINDYEQHLLDGVKVDPFTAETTTNAALDDPREYFLQVFSKRLRKAKNEWENLLLHIKEAIEIYVSLVLFHICLNWAGRLEISILWYSDIGGSIYLIMRC